MQFDKANEPKWMDTIINLEKKSDINFWCKALNCTEENLFFATSRIGYSAKIVNYFLQLNRLKINNIKRDQNATDEHNTNEIFTRL